MNEEKNNKIIVPDLTGFSRKNASALLESIGLETGDVFYDEYVGKKDIVINQNIKKGQEVEKGTRINLVYSSNNPIRFLPSVYQETDYESGEFLKKYLWIIQHLINSINLKLDDIHQYFNPMETTPEFLYWIASWFSIDANYLGSDEKSRLLIKNIVPLYQWRGTKIGIAKFLEILTGVKPEIIEDYIPLNEYVILDNKLVERPIIREDFSKYCFTIYFPVDSEYFDIKKMMTINYIVKLEKPAHSTYYIVFADKKKESLDSFIIGKDIINDNVLL
jgi:phage tail-like protein